MRYSARWLAVATIALAALPMFVTGWTPLLRFGKGGIPVDPTALFTFAFTAASIRDTLFAAALLVSFGPDIERQLGHLTFIALYLSAAIGGAATAIATPNAPAGGAFAGAVAMLVVYAYLWPLNRVSLLGITAIRARDALIFLVGYRLLFGFGFAGPGIDATPLGGLAVGVIWIAVLNHTSAASQYRRRLRAALVGDQRGEIDWATIPREGLHSVTLEELERVQRKAEEQGQRSLNDEERAFVHRLSLRQ